MHTRKINPENAEDLLHFRGHTDHYAEGENLRRTVQGIGELTDLFCPLDDSALRKTAFLIYTGRSDDKMEEYYDTFLAYVCRECRFHYTPEEDPLEAARAYATMVKNALHDARENRMGYYWAAPPHSFSRRWHHIKGIMTPSSPLERRLKKVLKKARKKGLLTPT